MLKAKLVVVGGDAKSTEVNLKLPTVIGRGKEAGLTVPHALVSRRHTELFERDGKLFVRDLGSLNGTFVDNAKIDGEKYLAPNQLLTLGNITFRAVYEVHSGAAISGPDTVTFEEFKTVEEDRPAPPQSSAAETPAVPDFQVDESTGESDSELEAAKARIRHEQITQPANVTVADKQPLVDPVEEVAPSAEQSVEEYEDSQGSIELESDIFNFDVDGKPVKDVSSTALEKLPGIAKQVSAIDEFAMDESTAKPRPVDSFKIDLGEEANKNQTEVDSGRLASFLRKLP